MCVEAEMNLWDICLTPSHLSFLIVKWRKCRSGYICTSMAATCRSRLARGNCVIFRKCADCFLNELVILFVSSLFFFFLTLLEYICFRVSCQFLMYSKVNQLYIYIYPLFHGFPSPLRSPRSPDWVPCAAQQVLICYLFYIQYQSCGSESVSHSAMSASLRPHRLQPARLLCLCNSPGKNTGMGCHFLLQVIFPNRD